MGIDAQSIVRDYLINAPEQSDWAWPDHCDGLAIGILGSLYQDGWRIVRTSSPNGAGQVFIKDEFLPDVDFPDPEDHRSSGVNT